MKLVRIKSALVLAFFAIQAWFFSNLSFVALLVSAIFIFIFFARPNIPPPRDPVLTISALKVSVELPSGGRRFVLNSLNLTIAAGEVHAIVGSNGSGKSSLARTILGDPAYCVESGSIEPLTTLTAAERSNAGFFVSWQSPVDVPGVTNEVLLHAGENARRRSLGEEEVSPASFREICKMRLEELGAGCLYPFLEKPVNAGLSGGERKKVELLALCVLRPQRLVILDELDSGLDVDAVATFTAVLGKYRSLMPLTAFILITHHTPLIPVQQVHVMSAGQISMSGGVELLARINRYGFDKV